MHSKRADLSLLTGLAVAMRAVHRETEAKCSCCAGKQLGL